VKTEKKLTLSKETLRTLDEKELSLVAGGAGSGNHNPAKCPGSHHPNCK
jgi:natural product precursor